MEGKCWDHRQLAKADGTRAVGGVGLGWGLGGIHFTLSDSCSHSITVHKHVCKNVILLWEIMLDQVCIMLILR